MSELRGVDVLQNEIEKSKDKLRGYNENIKKLTGRDPNRPGVRRLLSGERPGEEDGFQNRMSRGRGRLFGLARRSIMEDTGPPSKRRIVGGAFSRLGPAPMRRMEREDSPYEEELPHKLSVQSSVVATSRDAKNRDEIMQEQTKDKEGLQRNRRMFGLLLGTLNKFKTESKTLETKDVRRKKIEEKLEEKAEKERKKFKQETKLLMEEMHLEQSKISRLEQKMEMVQEHADREAEIMKLKNFIATKTKPRIFWKPVQMTTAAENKMKASKKFVDDMLQEGKDRLDKEILELMERENKREERIKMRLREDGLFGDEDGEKEDAERDDHKGEGVGRVVIETKDRSESIISRLGQKVIDEENEEPGPAELRKKSRRTVVLDTQEKEMTDTEEEDGAGEAQNKNLEQESEREDVAPESSARKGEIRDRMQNISDSRTDADKGDDAVKDSRHRSGDAERKSAIDERSRRKSGEKRDRDQEISRHRDDRKFQRNSTEEQGRDKDRQRTRERGKDRSVERDRRKHGHEDDRRTSRRDSRERSRRESRDERKEHKKEKRRQNRDDSDSDENSRPVAVKKEREEKSTGKASRKGSRSEESDEDDVVVKREKETENKERGEGVGDAESPVKLHEEDDNAKNKEQEEDEVNSTGVENQD